MTSTKGQSPDLGAFYDTAYAPGAVQPHYPWWYRAVARYAVSREQVVAGLLPGGRRLLDVGCGDGALLRLATRYEYRAGCEISLGRLLSARRPAPYSAVAANADGSLPFPDASFDTVTTIAVIAHVFDLTAFVQELRRVLTPGGLLVVQTPNLAFLPRRLNLLLGKQPWTSLGYGWDGGQLRSFTLGSLRTLLTESGFAVTGLAGSGFLPALRAPRRSLLSGDLIIFARRQT